MSPEDAIEKLPAALQGAFKATLEVDRKSERAHIKADLDMERSIRGPLENTKLFLNTASEDDRKTVGHILRMFHSNDDDGHGPGGPPRRGSGMPSDVDDMVRRMIEEVEREIQQLEQELKNL